MFIKKNSLDMAQIYMFLGLIGFTFCMRFLPHLFNVTPVMAVALLSGFHFRNRSIGLLVPLVSMLLSDIFIGLHALMFFTYTPILISVFLGNWMRSRSHNQRWPIKESLKLSVFGSILFFAVSNLGVFALSGIYPLNFIGLSACYVAALPFFERSLFGDLMFTGVLFSIYSFVGQYVAKSGVREMKHG